MPSLKNIITLIQTIQSGDASKSDIDKSIPHEFVSLAWGAYNGSFDDAHALHIALVPSIKWIITDSVLGKHDAEVGTHDNWYGASAPNPARAWLIAILMAFEVTFPNKEKKD